MPDEVEGGAEFDRELGVEDQEVARSLAARLEAKYGGQPAETPEPPAKPAKPAKPAARKPAAATPPAAPKTEAEATTPEGDAGEADDEPEQPEANAEGGEGEETEGELTLDSLERIAEAANLPLDTLLGQVLVQAPHGNFPLAEVLKTFNEHPLASSAAEYHKAAREHYETETRNLLAAKDAQLAEIQQLAVVLQHTVHGDQRQLAELRAAAAKGDPEASANYFRIVGEAEARKATLEQARNLLKAENQRRATLAREADESFRMGEVRKLGEKMPQLSNPEVGAKFVKDVQEYLTSYGFSPEEINQIADHRMLLVIDEAMKQRRTQTAAAEGRRQAARRAPRLQLGPRATGARQPAGAPTGDVAALTARAQETGRDEDVAALIRNRLEATRARGRA